MERDWKWVIRENSTAELEVISPRRNCSYEKIAAPTITAPHFRWSGVVTFNFLLIVHTVCPASPPGGFSGVFHPGFSWGKEEGELRVWCSQEGENRRRSLQSLWREARHEWKATISLSSFLHFDPRGLSIWIKTRPKPSSLICKRLFSPILHADTLELEGPCPTVNAPHWLTLLTQTVSCIACLPAKWRKYNLKHGVAGLNFYRVCEVLGRGTDHRTATVSTMWVNGAHGRQPFPSYKRLFIQIIIPRVPGCQFPLMSLKELPIHKLILEQSLDRHDTCHDFVFCLQVNYSCVSDPTHQPLHHIPGFLFRATRCFPEHPAQGVKQSPFTIDSSNTEWHTFSLETRLEQPWHVN